MKDENPCLVLITPREMKTDPDQPKVEESGITSLGSLSDRDISPVSHLPSFFKPVSWQFWSAGDDGPEQYPQPISQSNSRFSYISLFRRNFDIYMLETIFFSSLVASGTTIDCFLMC